MKIQPSRLWQNPIFKGLLGVVPLCILIAIVYRQSDTIIQLLRSTSPAIFGELTVYYLLASTLWFAAWLLSLPTEVNIEVKRDLRIHALSTAFRNVPFGAVIWSFAGRPLEYERLGVSARTILSATAVEVTAQMLSPVLALSILIGLKWTNVISGTLFSNLGPYLLAILAILVPAVATKRNSEARKNSYLIRTLNVTLVLLPSWMLASLMLWRFLGSVHTDPSSYLEVAIAWTIYGLFGILLGYFPIPLKRVFDVILLTQLAQLGVSEQLQPTLTVFGILLILFETLTGCFLLLSLWLIQKISCVNA